jgi:hypothetical protein
MVGEGCVWTLSRLWILRSVALSCAPHTHQTPRDIPDDGLANQGPGRRAPSVHAISHGNEPSLAIHYGAHFNSNSWQIITEPRNWDGPAGDSLAFPLPHPQIDRQETNRLATAVLCRSSGLRLSAAWTPCNCGTDLSSILHVSLGAPRRGNPAHAGESHPSVRPGYAEGPLAGVISQYENAGRPRNFRNFGGT